MKGIDMKSATFTNIDISLAITFSQFNFFPIGLDQTFEKILYQGP